MARETLHEPSFEEAKRRYIEAREIGMVDELAALEMAITVYVTGERGVRRPKNPGPYSGT